MPPKGKGAARKANLRSGETAPPPQKKKKGDAAPQGEDTGHEEEDAAAIAAETAERALFQAWKVAQSTSSAAAAA